MNTITYLIYECIIFAMFVSFFLSPISSVEHLLIFLLGTCIFSLEKCQLNISHPFLIVLLLLLLLAYRHPLLILYITPLSKYALYIAVF